MMEQDMCRENKIFFSSLYGITNLIAMGMHFPDYIFLM
jgi:hypothetical protein